MNIAVLAGYTGISEVNIMKNVYEVKYKDGNEIKTATVKAYTLTNALITFMKYPIIYVNLVAINEISFERYHALNTASAIREADTWLDCENECAELCRLAGMESEWREADGETFESVLIEAAKKLNVEI